MSIEEDDKIIAFLEHRLSEEETKVLLERMESDIRFRESVLLEKQLWETQNEDSWSYVDKIDQSLLREYEVLFRSEDTITLKEAIKEASAQYHYQDKKPKSRKWISYLSAAVVLVFISISIFFKQGSTSEELYASYYDLNEIPSLVSRSNAGRSLLIEAQEFFEGKEYEKALAIFNEELPSVSENKGTLMIYKGVSEMELGKSKEAMITFESLSKTNLLDASKGLWYKALLLLKLNKPEEAKDVLNVIVKSSGNYKYKEAQELLAEL